MQRTGANETQWLDGTVWWEGDAEYSIERASEWTLRVTKVLFKNGHKHRTTRTLLWVDQCWRVRYSFLGKWYLSCYTKYELQWVCAATGQQTHRWRRAVTQRLMEELREDFERRLSNGTCDQQDMAPGCRDTAGNSGGASASIPGSSKGEYPDKAQRSQRCF